MHDFIVVYAKNKNVWRPNLLVRSAESLARYKNPDNDPRGNWKVGDLTSKTKAAGHSYPIISPSGKTFYPSSGRQWAPALSTFENLLSDNRIWFGKNGDNVPSLKQFITEVQSGTVPLTIWLRDEVGDNQEAVQVLKGIFDGKGNKFETPKPPRLIERILQLATNKDSIVLDSFAGSGTTAHAVLNLNKQDGGGRKSILIEMMDYAETTTAERVKRIINGYTGEKELSGSFDFYELGQPLFHDGNINEAVSIEKIRAYIWYTETKTNLTAAISEGTEVKEHVSFLGKHNDTAYYFFYESGAITTLNHEYLAQLKTKAEQYVVFADNCLLTKSFMQKHHITFKKIPRDITRF